MYKHSALGTISASDKHLHNNKVILDTQCTRKYIKMHLTTTGLPAVQYLTGSYGFLVQGPVDNFVLNQTGESPVFYLVFI